MRMTMGAMVRFKEATGYDISEAKNDLSDSVRLMHCAVQSACSADGIEFNMDFMTFADNLSVEDLNQFNAAQQKKTAKQVVPKPRA